MAASNRNAFDDFFDNDEPESVVDTKAEGRLLRVPLGRMAPNGVNPRTDFGSPEQLEDLGRSLKRRQIQAVPVVTKRAYLKLWPDHRDRVGNVDVVIVSGERRWRAATVVDLGALDCVINDDLAASRKVFIEAVVSENVDRANFDPVEEAYAVVALVTEFGTNRAVAQHFERADGWVTQRVLLTHLAPAMQTLVRQKGMPVEKARSLGKLARDHAWTEEQQAEWWQEQQAEREAAAATRKAGRKDRKDPSRLNGTSPPRAASGRTANDQQAQPQAGSAPVITTQASSSAEPDALRSDELEQKRISDTPDVPDPRGESSAGAKEPARWTGRVPWRDVEGLARAMIEHMTEEEIGLLATRLIEHRSAHRNIASS
ncbi:hypothetical protein GCM10010232_66230 [Streptomyces amakusaensis]|uniref:ParB/RepB/Spo0J family partition protein n=1 Tax=Streptomyces amakusaensis TaxID=67271 RepID=A0ABW0AVL5_9ACTN